MTNNLLSSKNPLQIGDAVAAFLMLEDGRYLMQLRDDNPRIWYPDHWGLFGGGVDAGESPLAALRHELCEELEIEVTEARLFTRFEFDLRPIGLEPCFREYYEVAIDAAQLARAVLHEGAKAEAFPGEEALTLPRLAPYDAFALFLHHGRGRLVGSIRNPIVTPPR